MGSYLSVPITCKGVERSASNFIDYTSIEMQGCRSSMEDDKIFSFSLPKHPNFSLFGVFDGHCSAKMSEWLSTHLLKKLDFLEDLTDEAIKNEIVEMDNMIINRNPELGESGSTVIFALIDHSNFPLKCRVFNIGDSRAFLARPSSGYESNINSKETESNIEIDENSNTNQTDEQSFVFTKLSFDHKPDLPEERDRISNAGGFIVYDGRSSTYRVDGNLAMSRAFGDKIYKKNSNLPPIKQKVIALADVKEQELKKGDILFLTCDGIFEGSSWEAKFALLNKKLSSMKEEGILYKDFISNKNELKEKEEENYTEDIGVILARFLINQSYEVDRSYDNMTVTILRIGDFEPKVINRYFEPMELTVKNLKHAKEMLPCIARCARRQGVNVKDAFFECFKNTYLNFMEFFKKYEKEFGLLGESSNDSKCCEKSVNEGGNGMSNANVDKSANDGNENQNDDKSCKKDVTNNDIEMEIVDNDDKKRKDIMNALSNRNVVKIIDEENNNMEGKESIDESLDIKSMGKIDLKKYQSIKKGFKWFTENIRIELESYIRKDTTEVGASFMYAQGFGNHSEKKISQEDVEEIIQRLEALKNR